MRLMWAGPRPAPASRSPSRASTLATSRRSLWAWSHLGDNFVSVWHFNNDTKMWSFYTPALAEGNSLTHLITGETYLIRVKSTTEVILNNDTRNLTCVGDNCWNQLVW